jgi:hypothetical protein
MSANDNSVSLVVDGPSYSASGESSLRSAQAATSAGSVPPVVYCLDPSLANIKKAATPDIRGVWEEVYASIRSGGIGSVGDFQATLREMFAGQGGMDGARIVAAMDANFLTSVFRLLGAGLDDAFAGVYASLVPDLDLSRKRVKEFRSVFVRFVNANLKEEQLVLPLVVPDQGSGEEDEKERLDDDGESARIGDGSGKNEVLTTPRKNPRRSARPSKDGGKDAHAEGLSILNATVKRSGKSRRRSSSPDSDPSSSGSSTPSDNSDSDRDDNSSKKKKKSSKADRKKKAKERRSRSTKAPFSLFSGLSPSSGSDSSSSSSSESGSDDDNDGLDAKQIGIKTYRKMLVAGSARRYVREFEWNSERNEKEAMTLALAADALARNKPKEAFEIIMRRGVGVMMADRTGNWTNSSAIEWKNTDGVPLSHRELKFFSRRAKAFEVNNTPSRSTNRRSRQFANNGRSGRGAPFNRNNFNRGNNFPAGAPSSASNTSSLPRSNNSYRGSNASRSGQPGSAPGHSSL